jgi:7-keto-8-aminopelargonate synthetase-like enzyme
LTIAAFVQDSQFETMGNIFDKCDEYWARMKKVTGDHFNPDVFFRQFPISNCLPTIQMGGRQLIQVSTNDYLGLATHPDVIAAAVKVTQTHGIGTPLGARPLTGNTVLHLELEEKLAAYRKSEASLVFNLGLGAMSGTIACMVGRRERVFVDAYAHGCLHDGARLCKGEASWFGHNDMKDLESQLKACPLEQPKLIAVDGVYGMTGDLAPLPELVELKNKYNAQLFVDDAHGTGVLGDNGRGTPEHFGVEDEVDFHGGTFAKSFGTFGGYICGPKKAIDFIKFVSPGFMLTKALPAAITAATIKSLELMQLMPERRHQLWDNINVLRNGLRKAGFNIGDPQGAVTSIFTKGALAISAVQMLDEEHSFIVNPVMYPAVPYGTSIIRMTPSALHTTEQMNRLVNAIVKVSAKLPLLEGNQLVAHKAMAQTRMEDVAAEFGSQAASVANNGSL